MSTNDNNNTTVQYGNQPSKSIVSGKIALIMGICIAGIVAVYFIFRNFGKEVPEDQEISDADRDILNNTGKSKVCAPDLSPIKGDVVIQGSKDYNEVDHANIIAGISARYDKQLDDSIKALHPDRNKKVIGAGLGYILGSSEYEITGRMLDSFMTLSTVCATAFSEIDGKCVQSVAAVASAIGSSMESAQTCHTYEYTQKTSELNKFYQNETTTTKVSNKGGSILCGLLARGKSSSKSISVNSVKEETKQRTIDYIPHCKGKSIDAGTMEALFSTRTAALKTILTISAEGWNRFPTAETFFGAPKS